MGRVLGIDFGEKRCGIALSDPTHCIASAHSVISYRDLAEVYRQVKAQCDESEVEKIVVGLPLNMDGSLGPSAQRAQAFAKGLGSRVAVPVTTWDERLSTKSAVDALIEAGTRRRKRKGIVDKVAAQILLQHYLDAHTETD